MFSQVSGNCFTILRIIPVTVYIMQFHTFESDPQGASDSCKIYLGKRLASKSLPPPVHLILRWQYSVASALALYFQALLPTIHLHFDVISSEVVYLLPSLSTDQH